MGYLSHRVDPHEIKPGDHIYTWRTAFTYAHHGIYVGENKVIHFTAPGSDSGWNLSSSIPSSCLNSIDCGFSQPKSEQDCDSASPLSTYKCGFQKSESGVIVSCLSCFIGTGSLYLYQYGVNTCSYVSKLRGGTCTTAQSDPPKDVIDKAHYLLLTGFGKYNVVKNNCEDFALYCKTGLLVSGKPATGSSGQSVLEESSAILDAARLEAEERISNIRLREEQDAAYRAALEADQARERQKREEGERLAREAAEAERKQKEEDEARKKAACEAAEKETALLKLLEEKALSLGPEPEKGPEVTHVLVRLPNGERKGRRFNCTATIQSLYDFVDSSSSLEIGNYTLATNFPRVLYGRDKRLLTLNEAGLHPQESLFVELNS